MAMANRDAVNPDSASHFSGSKPQTNLRNPLPLSAAQEQEVKNIYYKRVRLQCGPEIKEFAECARGRTISATWHCRAQRLAMNSCMVLHATPVEEDAAREEWFASVMDRRRKKEEELAAVEKRRVEVIDMTRRQEEKERERMAREEEEKKRGKNLVEGNAEGGKVKAKGWWG